LSASPSSCASNQCFPSMVPDLVRQLSWELDRNANFQTNPSHKESKIWGWGPTESLRTLSLRPSVKRSSTFPKVANSTFV
jgi:hypothetical protein